VPPEIAADFKQVQTLEIEALGRFPPGMVRPRYVRRTLGQLKLRHHKGILGLVPKGFARLDFKVEIGGRLLDPALTPLGPDIDSQGDDHAEQGDDRSRQRDEIIDAGPVHGLDYGLHRRAAADFHFFVPGQAPTSLRRSSHSSLWPVGRSSVPRAGDAG